MSSMSGTGTVDNSNHIKTEDKKAINPYEYGMGMMSKEPELLSKSNQLDTEENEEDKEKEEDNVNVRCFKLDGREMCMAWQKRK